MELHGYSYMFFGGVDLSILNKRALEGWQRVVYETFAYDGMGGQGHGASAVYRKIASQLTDDDRQMIERFGEPKNDWVAPLGWLDDGRPWLTSTADGRIEVHMTAANELQMKRFAYGDGADHAIAARAVVLVVEALDEKRLDRK